MGRSETTRAKARKRSILAAGALGATLAYFFDPDRGRARRMMTRDRLGAILRRFERRGGRAVRRAESNAHGAWQRVTHAGSEPPPMDDETLKSKVETELFGRPDVAKGRIVVNVEDGVAVLRGEVGDPRQMTELAQQALKIPGVAGVRNLLHLPDEPAPNKAAALEASAEASDTT